ncbi:unnamed protein product [Linum trigynum]|uniref:ETFB lysine methyltransferase n=1 Tax=Linum trigynum TaxID=586398 RepID=A0AAV2EKV3_9ROSI
MSKSHFIKHLSFNLNRALVHRPPPLLPLPSLVNTTKPDYPFFRRSCFSSNIRTSSSRATFSSASAASPATSTDWNYQSYVSVRIRCPRHAYESFSEALLCFGASSSSVDGDGAGEEEEGGGGDGSYGLNEVVIDSVFVECQDVKACIAKAANAAGLKTTPSYQVKTGAQDDWIRQSLESFNPVEVTQGLWIVPELKSPPDINATNIILKPGFAFGTGEHPTTKLCLLLLKGLIKGGECFLDYGTGSGVLAIAALKFGAAVSFGIDVDEQAIELAHHNAVLNNMGPEKMKLDLVSGNKMPSPMGSRTDEVFMKTETCDVVVANILLNPLLELADDIVSFAKPGAVIGLSGILSEQVPLITNRYSQFWEDQSVVEMDGWACVSGTKRAKPNL